jgi:F0F1-type ATP synthase assembly protein I
VKQPSPVRLAQLAGAGSSVIICVVAGMVIGLAAAHFLHWDWAVPVGVIVGFAAGIASLFRRLSGYM